MSQPNESALPLEQWSAEMQAAVDKVCDIGLELLTQHRGASERALKVAEQWNLQGRLEDERQALHRAFRQLHRILAAIDATRCLMDRAGVPEAEVRQSMSDCAGVIENSLPSLQQDFLTVRHCALDLLRWARRFGYIENSVLPNDYRASYAQLLAYTPIFRPTLEAMQNDLLQRSDNSRVAPEMQQLLTQLTHYMASVESARAFVNSVVSPPMDLVFHDAESFQKDWTPIAPVEQGRLATELNDCCQLLLYDTAGFHEAVQNIQRRLPQNLDASIYVLPVDDWRIVFTMDEDPVFMQVIVTLLRVVHVQELDDTIASLVQLLYRDFSNR